MKTIHLIQLILVISAITFTGILPSSAQQTTPTAPVIPEADGYFDLPGTSVMPEADHVYKAIFNATKLADTSSKLLPALNMAGAELNLFAANDIPLRNVKFVIVFHGKAVDGILDDLHYKDKFGVDNPNLPVLKKLKKAGVELFVCGQQLAADNIDPKTLSDDVVVANDALIVLMTFQNNGYALLSF